MRARLSISCLNRLNSKLFERLSYIYFGRVSRQALSNKLLMLRSRLYVLVVEDDIGQPEFMTGQS